MQYTFVSNKKRTIQLTLLFYVCLVFALVGSFYFRQCVLLVLFLISCPYRSIRVKKFGCLPVLFLQDSIVFEDDTITFFGKFLDVPRTLDWQKIAGISHLSKGSNTKRTSEILNIKMNIGISYKLVIGDSKYGDYYQ